MEMGKKEVIRLWDLFGSDFLGLRVEGEVVREKIEDIVMKRGGKVVLDFEGVKGITHCFADEVVGIFTRAFGKEWVKENISVVNANENVRGMLNLAVKIAFKQRTEFSKA
jgi:hypothetical protein